MAISPSVYSRLIDGTPEQQDRWLPGLASGERLIAFALTEADAGSDPSGVRTRAVRDGDDYVIDGGKRFISHASVADYVVVFAVTNPDAERPSRRLSAIVVETEKKETAASWKDRKSYIAGNGHGWTSNTSLDDGKRSSPAFDEYKKALASKVGDARMQQILTPRLHNSLIYPNMSIMGLNIHVRVIKPLAVDKTEVTIYPIRLCGAPDSMNFGNIRLLNVTHSAASFVQTDDLESFTRAQKGLRSHATDWVDISRGLGEEEPDRELNATRALATHEMVVRAQYKAWLGYMREAG